MEKVFLATRIELLNIITKFLTENSTLEDEVGIAEEAERQIEFILDELEKLDEMEASNFVIDY